METFWQIVASNAALVVVLAAGVALLGRVWRNPLCLHLLWVCVLVKLVTPPLATIPVTSPVAPALEAREFEAFQPALSSSVDVARRAPGSASARHAQAVASRRTAPLRDGSAGGASGTQAVVETSASNLVGAPLVTEPPTRPWPWLTILAWTWAAGVILFALRSGYRILRFRRLLRHSEPAGPAVLAMAGRIAERLGLGRVPDVCLLPVSVSPLVWSLGGRPRVYLPAALFERLDAAAQEAILAHELAHVRRGDHWVRLLEMIVVTLFWWHPVVWWAARQLQELEDQCCDRMAADLAPNGLKGYAGALLDTLDFLCDRAVPAPLGATATKSSVSLTRRIAMLRNRSWTARWTFGRLAVVLAVAAVPMTLAFGQKPPEAVPPTEANKPPVVERLAVNRLVKDFPEKADLSTPESAAATYHRALTNPDPKVWLDLGAYSYTPRDVKEIKQKMNANGDRVAEMDDAYGNAEIVEVLTYRDGLAEVISKLKLADGAHDPYSGRSFVRINGQWKNFGENRLPSVEAARKDFERIKDNLWKGYIEVLDGLKKGKPVRLEAGDLSSSRPKRSAPIAPGQPLGISVEKADLMGRVEWAFMHGARDVTARKTIEWGEIEKDKEGNRTIRYKYYATIWDKDVLIANQVFTFDAKGNILNVDDVEGFPQKKVEKPVDVTTQAGLKELVEGFFTKNFVDVTSRDTIEWGDVAKAADGNASIRYKYRATIWNKDIKIMNQVFTFDPKGEFVSYKDVEGFPKDE